MQQVCCFVSGEWFTCSRPTCDNIHSRYAASSFGYVKYDFHMFIQFKFKVREIISTETDYSEINQKLFVKTTQLNVIVYLI